MRVCLLGITLLFGTAFAAPWMTGPLLAPSGKTIPAGHVNIETYGFYSRFQPDFNTLEAMPILTVGLAPFMDVQMAIPYTYNWVPTAHGNGIGDLMLALGVQVAQQNEQTKLPDIRLVFQEIYPSGRFEQLNELKQGTDQTGIGALTSLISLNIQHLQPLAREHYLRTRFTAAASHSKKVFVFGANSFGGTANTSGSVRPGNSYSLDLAFEYALTQNWVPVFEMLYTKNTASTFDGNPGFTPGGVMASIGGAGGEQYSLAPAIEYNFSGQLGVIAGAWFSVSGPHDAQFQSAVIAVNYYM